MRSKVLVLDVGSSSLRCSSFDDKLRMIHSESRPFAKQLDGLLETLTSLYNNQRDDDEVVAVGLSCFVMNLIGLQDGVPKVLLDYSNHDPSLATILDTLTIDRASLYQRTGTPLHTSYALAQLLHLDENYQSYQWTTIASYCISQWTQQPERINTITHSEASWTGLLNRHTLDWDTELLDQLLPNIQLPRIDDWNHHHHDSYFFGGIGDGACATAGSKSRIAVTIGTSAAARVLVPHPTAPLPQGLFEYCVSRHQRLVGGALTDGGNIIVTLQRLLGTTIDWENVARAYPSPSIPIILPFYQGERSTGFRSRAQSVWFGTTHGTTPAELVLAHLVGITLRLVAIVELLPSSSDILVSGKALERNWLWRQMLADATGRTVIYDPTTREGTSRGLAKLLWEEIRNEPLDDPIDDTAVYSHPNTETKDFWRDTRERHERLLLQLDPLFR